MRLFFAIELPPEVQTALGRWRVGDAPDYRWVDPSLLHVTLVFLGDQPSERLAELQAVATEAAAASRPATLSLGPPGSFGPKSTPRVLWVGLAGDVPALEALQARLETGLRQAAVQLEDRPFRAHVTLARRRTAARSGAPAGWPPAHTPSPNTFEMRHLTLFESRLSPRGATYSSLFESPLGS